MTGVTTSRAGDVDEELVALLRSALAGLADGPSGMRARLMAGLAVELFWGPAKDEQRRLATDALAMARQTGDREALKAALLGGWTLIDGSAPFIDEMRSLYDEAEAQTDDDPVATLYLHRGQLAFAAVQGDREEMRRRLALVLDIGSQLRQPRLEFIARADEATVNAFSGDLAIAEQQVIEAMGRALEQGVEEVNVMGSVGAILYMVRRAQGRVDELVPAIENLVETQPGAPVWRVALAGALSESERADEAVEHVVYLAGDGCANVPPDVEYPVTLCGLARLTRTVALDEATMRYLYDHLLPFAGTYNWSGTSLTDANDHGLGVLAARLGEFEASDAHFAATVALGERSGARPYLAQAHLDWARLLAERGEVARARHQARESLALAGALGMDGPFGAVGNARRLLTDLDASG